jgi:hypothetical protein
MMVQVKENYQQRGYGKVWDTFLSNYGKGLIGLADRAGGLLYVLAIKGDFKRHQDALHSR